MASLHRPGDPKPVLCKPPQTFAKYLGRVGDAIDGEAQWEIMGEVYTGTVVTYSTEGSPGPPSVGNSYPAHAMRPHLASGWAVCVPQGNKVRNLQPSMPGWDSYGATFGRMFGLSSGSVGEEVSTVDDVAEPLLWRYSATGLLLVTLPGEDDGTFLLSNPGGELTPYEHTRIWWEFCLTSSEVVALDFNAANLTLEPDEDNVSGLVCLELSDLSERWAITLPNRILTVVVP